LLLLRTAWSGRSGAAGSAVFQGRQASRGGDSPQGFPWRQAKRRGREGIGIGRSKKGASPRRTTRRAVSAISSSPATPSLQLLDDARLNEDARLVLDRHVEHLANT
jgi:hypothetical protein